MSTAKSDAFAAIAAMDPDQENAARLAGLERPQAPPFTAPVLVLGSPSPATNCPACDAIRTEQDLAATLASARAAHAPFLENHAPPLESHRASIELRSFEWRLRPSADWQAVTLPHYGGPMGRHTAEYRTTFELPDAVRVQEVQMLRFTGVDYKAHVFLNGVFTGSHEGFFAPFEFDITPHLRAGTNELLVLVENDAITRGNQSWHHDAEGEKLYAATFIGWDEPELAWHHGPPGMGIWGRVLIEGRSASHIGDLFVRPLPAEDRAELWFEIFNASADYASRLTLDFSISGRNFREARCEHTPLACPPRLGPNRNVLKVLVVFADARLWSPETPWLYQLQARLLRDGHPIDTLERQFGMRSFCIDESTDPKGKIFLNGSEIRLRGANTMGFEQIAAMKGDWQRLIDDILLAKICGMNFWRFTQRPVQSEIYDLCDRLGLMAQSDLPHFGTVRQTQFAESVRQSEEMERLIRGHPSSVLVSYINEPFPEAWHRNGHRHLARHDLENLFESCTHAIHLHNPDRMVKPIDGDYDPPGPGIADTHCYNGWYQWDRLPLGALNKGGWHQTKPGWHYGCGEFGAEGLDPADLMRRCCPAHWLAPDPVDGWNPGMISHCQTGRHQPMWFEAPADGAHSALEEWVEASQRFQALIVRLTTEAFRRDDRMVTFAIHLFIDAWPTGWMKTIMDCERRPKKAFFAYLNALRPMLLTLRMDRWAFASGEPVEAEIHISNDTHAAPALRVHYQVERDGQVLQSGCVGATTRPLANSQVGLVRWTAPAVTQRTTFTLRATLVEDASGRSLGESAWQVAVFPEPPPVVLPAVLWSSDGGKKGDAPIWFERVGGVAEETAEVVLARGPDLSGSDLDKLVAQARRGSRVLIDRLPEGIHRIDGEEIQVLPTANGPRHAACRNTGHPLVAGFEADDFRFWFDAQQGHFTPIHDTTFFVPGWTPVVKTATGTPKTGPIDPPREAFFRPSHVVARKTFGTGSITINQLDLDRFVGGSPVARIFARRLLG